MKRDKDHSEYHQILIKKVSVIGCVDYPREIGDFDFLQGDNVKKSHLLHSHNLAVKTLL